MMERGLWHPVVALRDLGEGLHTVTLLGTPLLLWRAADGSCRAWLDQCPHRGARLSLGRIVEGRVECPYHGWRFAADGACAQVPSTPGWMPPATHAATAYACAERYGLLWVKLQPSDADLPAFEWEDDAALRQVLVGPYDVASSAPRLVENFLDVAHFPFVHEGSLGDRARMEQAAYEVQEGPQGIVAPDVPAWQPQAFAGASHGVMVSYRYEVRAPYYTLLAKNHAQTTNAIAMFICPVGDEASRCWFRMAVTPDGSSEQALVDYQDMIFRQDQPVVESQRPRRLPLGAGERHGPLDRISTAYRRYLKRLGVTVGTLPHG